MKIQLKCHLLNVLRVRGVTAIIVKPNCIVNSTIYHILMNWLCVETGLTLIVNELI